MFIRCLFITTVADRVGKHWFVHLNIWRQMSVWVSFCLLFVCFLAEDENVMLIFLRYAIFFLRYANFTTQLKA